jgi:hypothetical protein
MAPQPTSPAVDDEDPDRSPVADPSKQRPAGRPEKPATISPDPATDRQVDSQQTGKDAGSK